MRIAIFLAGLAFAATASAQLAAPKPLVTNGPIEVNTDDFEAFLLRVAPEHRAEFRANYERVAKTVDQVYANRVLAAEARKAGIDRDPRIQLRIRQLEEGLLAQAWTEHYQKTLKVPDFSQRAEEVYRLNKERFYFEERVTGNYLQLSLFGRTREEGLALARQLRALAVAGASFPDLVKTHSDDPALRRNRGRIEAAPAKDLEKPLAEAAFALKSPGDITEPVETATAFHLFQLEKRTPARQIPFAEVRDQIIESEKQTWLGNATDRRIGELKNTPQTKVYDDNVRGLLREFVPPEVKAGTAGQGAGAGSKAP